MPSKVAGSGDEGRRVHAGADLVLAREVAEGQVVRVHMLPRRDRLRGLADDLVVAPHRLAGGDRRRRDLVPGRHQAGDGDAFAVEHGAAEQLAPRDDDVVGRVDADEWVHASIRAGSQAKTFWRCSPSLSMPSFITSPGFRKTGLGLTPMPTPGGVPVVIRSPGFSVMNLLR